MQILSLLGMYFNAAVVFFIKFSLLFRSALAIRYKILRSHKGFLENDKSLIRNIVFNFR